MKFYDKGIIVDYLKGVLSKTPIPTCKAWHEGMGVVKDNLYILEHSLMRATKTIVYDNGEYYGEGYDKNKNHMQFFYKISDYYFGDHINGVTVKYKSNSREWNRLDHWMLGMYLRWQKELFGNNLMYGYNCWDGDYLQYTIENNSYVSLKKKIFTFTVPIIAGREYTIFGDSPTGCLLAVGYSDEGRPLNNYCYPIKDLGCLSRNKPYVMKISKQVLDQNFNGIKEYLTLYVQVPYISSGIFVLEGNYLNTGNQAFGESIERGTSVDIENMLYRNTACLDRVVEGMTGNIINGLQFEKSIEWMQEVFSSTKWRDLTGERYEGEHKKGIFDNVFKQWLQNRFKNPMNIKGRVIPPVKNFNGDIVKEIEKLVKEVM